MRTYQVPILGKEDDKRLHPILIGVAAGLALSLLIAAIAAFCVGPGFADRFFDLDMAMLEMYTRHAADGQQLLGPYSRFGWNHPGPAYFYLLAPLYLLSGESSTSMFLTARIVNLLSVLCMLGALYALTKESGPLTAVWSCLVTLLYVVYLGAGIVGSPWNPWIVVLPTALFMVCCAAFAAGRPLFLPAVVGIGSCLVQTHIGLLPLVAAASVVSVVLLLVRRGSLEKHPRWWTASVIVSALIILVMWAPPLYEEVSNHPGNLTKVIAFFGQGTTQHTLGEAFAEVSKPLAWLPLLLVRSLPFKVPEFEYAFAGQVFAMLQLVLLPLAAWTAARERHAFQAGLAILGVAEFIASVWAGLHVQGGLFGYLLTWTSAVGLVNWIVLGGVAADRIVAAACSRGVPRSSSWLVAIALGFMVVSAGGNVSQFFTQSLSVSGDSQQVKHLSQALIDWMKANDIRRPVIHFDWNNWPVESGIVLQLHKAGIPFAIVYTWPTHGRSDWPLLLGKGFQPRPDDKIQIVFRTSNTVMEPSWKPIAAYCGLSAYERKGLNVTR